MISPQVIQELLTVRQVLHYLPASPKTEKGWSPHEQQLFWDALTEFPHGPWTTIAEFIGTKSTRQAMTHGQKLRQKLNRWRKRLRRTPAAAAALAEDPMLLDDDVRVSMVLSSAMMTSSALPVSSTMTAVRNSSPITTPATFSVSAAIPTTFSMAATMATARTTTHTLDHHHGPRFDNVPAHLHYNTRSSSRQLAHNMSCDLDTIAATSSGLAAADANFTELLMASFPPAPTMIPLYAGVPYSASMLQPSGALNRAELSVLTTSMAMAMPTLPPSLVSSERLANSHHVHRTSHAAHRRPTSLSQSPSGSAGLPSFLPEDERYVIPQSMVDDLADVLWSHEQ